MLIESIVDNIEDCTVLQSNTDGITIKIKKTDKDLLFSLCERWEELTKLKLEYQSYKTFILRDVNNYLAIDINNKIKPKGCFEIIPMQNGAIAYNKNWSMRVVPKALHAYYLEGIPIDEFIRNHTDIFDFCLSFRARAGWEILKVTINEENEKEIIKQQRTVRYYISTTRDSLIKRNEEDKRIVQLNAGFSSVLFNKYIKKEMKDYNINYAFYISEANKIKSAVYTGQLKLFES